VTDSSGSDQANDAAPAAPRVRLDPNVAGAVFISYSSQDAAVAAALVEALERHGLACWIAPRDVKAGALYADAIVRAISSAKAFVLVLSESAIASSHVGKEVERASSKKRPIIALRIDATPLTPAFEYFLSESQWVEVQAGNMEAAYAKLFDAIREPERPAPGIILAVAPEASAGTAPPVHPNSRRNRILLVAGLAVVAVALAALLADKFWLAKHVTADEPTTAATNVVGDKSIAVLPFTDMSEKHDQEYFSDGMAEEIIDLLVKVPELKIPARTSSFYFKGKSTQIPEIAKELGVAHVLEGSVRKSGDHLRVTAQLIRADNGYHLWSETYDRQLDDVFKVQDEIAGAVVSALKVTLLAGTAPNATPTTSIAANDLYLQARSLIEHYTPDDALKAYADLQQAVNLDPKFALAWTTLAEVLSDDNVQWDRVFKHDDSTSQTEGNHLQDWGSIWAQARAAAHAAAEKALELAPDLAESHAAMAKVLEDVDWDWAAADAQLKRARELEPSNAGITLAAARLAMLLGRVSEGLQLANRAATLDPLGRAIMSLICWGQYASGAFDEAQVSQQKLIALYPTAATAHYQYALVLLALGGAQAALSEFERETADQYREVGLPLALDALGRRVDADQAIVRAEQIYGYGMAYQIAYIYVSRNDVDHAFYWLERAYRQHDTGLAYMKVDPMLKNLERDPRYKALLRKVRLPE
jgi:TolB-like protein